MILLSLRYISGKYHATPYDRNVNEGEIEYPPSPYRIIRTLIDTWKRKLNAYNNTDYENLVINILGKLSTPPLFYLPHISKGFTLNYLNENDLKDSSKGQLIYDSFVSINPNEKILILWKDVNLNNKEIEIFKNLLKNVNYIGRSESWTEIKLENNDNINIGSFNCYPINTNDNITMVKVALPISIKDYLNRNNGFTNLDWLESLEYDTEKLLDKHMDKPPGLIYVPYRIPEDIIRVKHTYIDSIGKNKFYGVIYSLNSQILPLITDSILIGERMHTKVIGVYKKEFNNISSTLSGICDDGTIMMGHRHIFISPIDFNNDGRIDHIIIKSKLELTENEIYCLDSIKSLWQNNGKPDIHLVPIEWLTNNESKFINKSRVFQSQTPFVLNKHFRRGRGDYLEWVKKQVNEELSYIGLPNPKTINLLNKAQVPQKFHWLDFKRNRKGDLSKIGYGFELTFENEINMPFNIGYASHFGLGLFMPKYEVKNIK